jgi:hypothetical protein
LKINFFSTITCYILVFLWCFLLMEDFSLVLVHECSEWFTVYLLVQVFSKHTLLLNTRFLIHKNSTIYVSEVPNVTWCIYFIYFGSVFHISIYVLNIGLRLFKPCLLEYVLWNFYFHILNYVSHPFVTLELKKLSFTKLQISDEY